jgi:alkylation response protein AidB-like acyl-CoA dehydrogenase
VSVEAPNMVSELLVEVTEEAAAFRDSVWGLAEREFAPLAAAADRDKAFPEQQYRVLADSGLLGIQTPEEYGGQGGSIFEVVLALEQIAQVCVNTAMLVMTQNGAAPGWILKFGSEDQRERLLPALAGGRELIALCLSEPNAGSDLSAATTKVTPRGSGLSLTGRKSWVTLASRAAHFVVVARFGDEPGADGLGMLIVPSNSPGITLGPDEDKLGWRALPQCEVLFEDVEVGEGAVLLGPGRFKDLMNGFNEERLGNIACSVGVAQAALNSAIAYTRERETFGAPISDRQGVRWMLADLAVSIEASRLLLYRAAQNVARGDGRLLEVSMAKKLANETVRQATTAAVQLHGAAGFTSAYPVERMHRDGIAYGIGGGAIEIHKTMIAEQLLRGRWKPTRGV